MKFLLETQLHKRRSGHGHMVKRVRRRHIESQEVLTCAKCKCKLNHDTATLDHVIPNIVIIASRGRLKQSVNNFRVLCGMCNHRDMIPNWLGILFKSNEIDAIRMASRNLCNLVRGS